MLARAGKDRTQAVSHDAKLCVGHFLNLKFKGQSVAQHHGAALGGRGKKAPHWVPKCYGVNEWQTEFIINYSALIRGGLIKLRFQWRAKKKQKGKQGAHLQYL